MRGHAHSGISNCLPDLINGSEKNSIGREANCECTTAPNCCVFYNKIYQIKCSSGLRVLNKYTSTVFPCGKVGTLILSISAVK